MKEKLYFVSTENESPLVYATCVRQARNKCRFLKEKILSVRLSNKIKNND